MTRVRRLLAGAVATLVALSLAAACNDGSAGAGDPATPATLPTPPSSAAAAAAPGAAALGDAPASSSAGRPVDTVDWVTPAPAEAPKGAATPARCHQDQESAKLLSCVFGDRDGSIDVVVAGDSKTQQWMPALDVAGKRLGWRIVVHTKSACPFTTAATARGGVRGSYPSCDEWNRRVIADVKRRQPDLFINALYKMRAKISGSQDRADARSNMIEGVRDAVGRIARSGAHVVIIDSTPMMDEAAPACITEHPDQLTRCDTPRTRAFGGERTWDDTSVRRVLSGAPGSSLVDLNPYVCPAAECIPVIGNVLVYRDTHHLTVDYVRTLAPMLLRALRAVTVDDRHSVR